MLEMGVANGFVTPDATGGAVFGPYESVVSCVVAQSGK